MGPQAVCQISAYFTSVHAQPQSHVLATPWTVALQAPLSIRFRRQEYWSGLLFPPAGTVPDPGIESASPPLEGNFLTTGPPEKQGIAIYPFVHVPCQQMGSGHCCARPFLSSWCPRAEPARGSALRLQGAWEGRQETETSYVLLTRWKVMRGRPRQVQCVRTAGDSLTQEGVREGGQEQTEGQFSGAFGQMWIPVLFFSTCVT